MSPLSAAVIALSMSADAFAVSVAKGACEQTPSWRKAIRHGFIFGIIEAITPFLGWLAGRAAASYIEAVDHWVAFTILSAIGGKLIYEGFQRNDATGECAPDQPLYLLTMLTAVGTSIDALAVGVTFAFLSVHIGVMMAAIGLATFTMSTIGLRAGHYLGQKAGKYAEILGGIGLIGIGSVILTQHLGAI